MSYCKYCGALIDWIKPQKGRTVPVEYRPVVVMPDHGTEVFITDAGEWIKGARTIASPVGGNLVAYVPHRRYCPGQHERGGQQS